MALSGDGCTGERYNRPSHLPKEIEDEDWKRTPVPVRKHILKLNYELDCMKDLENEAASLTKQLTESKDSLKASELAVTKLELEVKKLQEERKAVEAKVTELETQLGGKEDEWRVSEEKTSEIQQEWEKAEEKWRVSEANAAALQAKMEGVQVELEGVRKQLHDQVSRSTKILAISKDETEQWKMMAMKYKAVIRSVRGTVSEISDNELDNDANISQDQLNKLENTSKIKSRLQEGEENKNLLVGHNVDVMILAKKERKYTTKINSTTENKSHQNTDLPLLIPLANSSHIQNSATVKPEQFVKENAKTQPGQGVIQNASIQPEQDVTGKAHIQPEHCVNQNTNVQPEQCAIQNANNKSADLTANTVGLDAEDNTMNLVQDKESTTSACGDFFQNNLRSSTSQSSHDVLPESPIAYYVNVKQEVMDDGNSDSEETAPLNENSSNTNGSTIRATPEASLIPSQAGSAARNLRKRPITDQDCNSSIKILKANVFKATRSLRPRPVQSPNQKKLTSFAQIQEEFSLSKDLQGHPKSRHRHVNLAKKRKHRCKLCKELFDSNNELKDHTQNVHSVPCVTPQREIGARSTVNNMASPQTSSSTTPGQRIHGKDPDDPSKRLCLCGTRFPNKVDLAWHLDVELFGGKLYGCIYCDNNYLHLRDMKDHVKDCHADKECHGNKMRCGFCHVTYSKLHRLRDHYILCHKTLP